MGRIPAIIHPETLSPILSPRSLAAQHARSTAARQGQQRHPHKQKWPEITTV